MCAKKRGKIWGRVRLGVGDKREGRYLVPFRRAQGSTIDKSIVETPPKHLFRNHLPGNRLPRYFTGKKPKHERERTPRSVNLGLL